MGSFICAPAPKWWPVRPYAEADKVGFRLAESGKAAFCVCRADRRGSGLKPGAYRTKVLALSCSTIMTPVLMKDGMLLIAAALSSLVRATLELCSCQRTRVA